MPRVIHFEISCDELDRAIDFYKKVFGWKVEKWQNSSTYHLVDAGVEGEPGINGALMPREKDFPPVCNTIGVSNVDEYMEKIASSGGEVITPRTPIPGVGYFAYCKDTEGNVFGIMHRDPNAS